MGLRDDLERFRGVGEENREDLEDFIKHGQLQTPSGEIQVPIKIIDLPEFVYADPGGIGQARPGDNPDVGDPVDVPEDEGEGEEAGEGSEQHGYYEMDPEEFAEEMDEEFDLDLDPKGKKVVEKELGDMVDVSRAGPRSALDLDYLYKEGLKRLVATWYDEEFLRESCLVEGTDADDVFDYVRTRHSMPVDRATVGDVFDVMRSERHTVYDDFEALESEYRMPRRSPPAKDVDSVPIRREDERYRHPEIVEKKQKNVVIVNIRDVSGSMFQYKRELVERVFTPMDWYLHGKYEHAESRYVAHDYEAWEVERMDFFGIESGGGTRVSSAYKLVQELLDKYYPWSAWNRYVFAAGDGENSPSDTESNVVPLIEEIDANLHAYVEVDPNSNRVGGPLRDEFGDDESVVVTEVNNEDDVIPAIKTVLGAASQETQED